MQQKPSLSLKLIIVLFAALPQMSTDIYLPSMPSMATYFKTSLNEIQYTIFFYTVGFSLGALVFGPISDRVGRRPVILVSLIIAAIGSVCALFATNLHVLFNARFIQGFALVGIGSLTRAIVKDICYDKQEMAKFGAILGVSIPIASSIAPVIGGYIEKFFFWRISFAFLLVYIIIFLVYTAKYLPETNLTKLERPLGKVLEDFREVVGNSRFFRYNAITAFALCSIYAYLTESSYLLQIKVGLSPEQFGYTNLLVSAALILSSYINGKLLYRLGSDKLLHIGVICLASSGVIFLFSGIFNLTNLSMILIPLFILVWGCGFIYPNASAGGLSLFSQSAGTAGAIYAFIQMLGGAAGSGAISWLTHYGNPLECLGAFILLLGIVGHRLSKQLLRPIHIQQTELNNEHQSSI